MVVLIQLYLISLVIIEITGSMAERVLKHDTFAQCRLIIGPPSTICTSIQPSLTRLMLACLLVFFIPRPTKLRRGLLASPRPVVRLYEFRFRSRSRKPVDGFLKFCPHTSLRGCRSAL